MKVLVTGTAGFIGFHVANYLLARGDEVVGLDSINDYYDVNLKYGRLDAAGIARGEIREGALVQSTTQQGYRFVQMKLEDREGLEALFAAEQFDAVCNLAAQAGVRYSLENPRAYIDANISGFMNILECCRYFDVKNLSFASSSSVYGLNESMPFSTSHNVDHPISLYAATKKSNELMAHTYAHLYGLQVTGLRFFTVYGPWGRPDMAPFLFTSAAFEGREIKVFNHGKMKRDFTYIDDIVEGVVRVIDKPAQPNASWRGASPDPSSSSAAYKIYNIGNNQPEALMDFIQAIENAAGREIPKQFLPIQPGDVPATFADVDELVADMGYKPATPLQEGINRFVAWYRDFYRVGRD
ncbi:MAG: NAD-dependent epimerase [Idiomarina sp.]|nr:NAD-dependent epimerase [Idiomarina sp.]